MKKSLAFSDMVHSQERAVSLHYMCMAVLIYSMATVVSWSHTFDWTAKTEREEREVEQMHMHHRLAAYVAVFDWSLNN